MNRHVLRFSPLLRVAALYASLCLSGAAAAEEIPFNYDLWQEIRRQKEDYSFEKKSLDKIAEEADSEEIKKPVVSPALLPKAQFDIALPAESGGELAVSGRKSITMKFGKVLYKERDASKRTASAGGTDGFDMDMDQQLQIKIKGKVGRKIDVDINYDDNQGDLNRRNIQIKYTGDPDEIVQKVEFGDITLSLPGTEFVGYSGKAGLDKNLFGFMGSAKYKDLSMWFVGSQTKGLNEIKRFTGSTEFRKPTINDASYLSRRYYKLYNSTASLPLARGSVEIWVDDRIGENNLSGITQPMTVIWGTQTFNGHFDLLKPGIDYVVDHSRGIVTFYKSIAKDAIIACDWSDTDGNTFSSYNAGGYKTVIKDDGARVGRSAPDEDHYELKNRYSLLATNIIRDALGEKFIIKILDNANSETTSDGNPYVNFSSAAFTVDYDLGIIEFSRERPFEDIGKELGFDYSDTYDPSYQGERRHFAIYSEYRVKLNTYLLRPSIVKDSERITLDGKVLDKDRDYMLDYYSGWITFLNTEDIKDESSIEASYEYYPFVGGQEQTLAGTRLEYRPGPNFFVGGTMLYNFAPSAGDIPSIYQTSPSTLLLDINTALSINPKRNFPFRLNFSGEAAQSENDPNKAGKAIIENMENIKQTDSISTYEKRWQPLAIQDRDKRGMLVWSEISGINMRDLNPFYYTDKDDTSALAMNYSLMPDGGQTALVHPISNAGADYSLKKYIEGYIWGSGKNETLIIELGRFNEDADGDAKLDTEDKNNDNFLNDGEDTGVKFNYPGSAATWFTWGEDNGRLNSEDLDGDDVLSTDENIIYSTAVTVSWSGWQKFRYELPITATNRTAWRSVKQIGLTIGMASGAATTGEIKIADVGLVGNRWQKPVLFRDNAEIDMDIDGDDFDVSAINNETDPEYAGKSLLYTPYYNELYAISDLETREQALRINYKLSPNATAYTYASYTRMDLFIYKTLNFFVYGENSGNSAFIRMGNDRANYYEYFFTDDFTGWKAFSISLLDENYDSIPDGFQSQTGSVNLNNITRIFVGIKSGDTAFPHGELWFNDIYVSGVKKETGSAKKAQASVELPGWFTVSGSARDIDSNFKSMTFASSSDQDLKSGDISFNRLRWMPLSGHIEKSVITTPREKVKLSDAPMAQYLSAWDEGRIEKNLYSLKGALNIKHLPQFSGDYSHSVTSNTLAGKTDSAETAHGRMTYTLPNLIILPKNITADYSRSITEVEYNAQISNVDTENKTETFYGDAQFYPLKALNFSGNYKLTRNFSGKKLEENSIERLLNSQNAAAGISGNLRPFKWLNTSFNYSAAVTENYALPASTEAWKSIGLTLKDINRTSSAGFGIPLNMNSLINFGPTNSLTFNYNLKVTDADVYKNVDKDFKALDKLFLRDNGFAYTGLTFDETNPEAELYSYSTSRADTLSTSYKPFSFLNLDGAWTPLGTTDIQLNYTSNLARTELTGTPSQSLTLTFPDARIRISSLEKIPFFGKDFSAINTLIEIYNSKTEQKNLTLNSTARQGLTLNFKWQKFTVGTGFKMSETENLNLQQNVVAGNGKDKSWNTSVNFDLWQKWHSNVTYSGANNAGFAAGGIMSKDDRSHTISGKLHSDTVKMRKIIRMPFSSKKMEIDQNVRYNIDFSGTLKRSSLNVTSTNYQLYTGNFSMDFDMSSNFRWSLGGGLSYADYTKRRENNYMAFHISTKLEIIF
ncbi:MAG: hypothetical protein COS41_03280 [Elusimicrobia bacterium CG03_land_8_20_14_0_80_50_18]|nr:MAG: hypothetical protein COS41_03280 [Elusimicrobia bacterium CG03_land_8_20_14_0_80_50_18]